MPVKLKDLTDVNLTEYRKLKDKLNHGPFQSTVRKRRDPAILDCEEVFLQLDIEEIFFSEEFSNPFSKIIYKVANKNRCAPNKQHQDFIAYHS